MRGIVAAVGIGIFSLVLAGCASAGSGEASGGATAATTVPVTITVTSAPILGDHTCPASIGFPAYQHTVKPEGTQLSIADANGKTVGLSKLGSVSKVGDECHWQWKFDLPEPESDFYLLSWGSEANTFTSTWLGKRETTVGTAEVKATKADLVSGLSLKMTDYLGAWDSD